MLREGGLGETDDIFKFADTFLAFEQGVKTVYYVRSKSLEVEDCTACST